MRRILIVPHDDLNTGATKSLINWISDVKEENVKFVFLINKRTQQDLYKEIYGKYEIIETKFRWMTYKYSQPGLRSIFQNILRYLFNRFMNIFEIKRAIKKIRHGSITLIHSNSLGITLGAEIAYALKIPHIWHVREFMDEDFQMRHFNPNRVSKLMRYSNAIFISKSIQEKFINNFSKSRVVYNQVKYDEKYIKTREFMNNHKIIISFVGQINRKKGQLDAIKAINRLKSQLNIEMFVIGSGSYEKDLKDYVRVNKIDNIYFEGYQKNVLKYRQISDIAIIGSEKEAFGRTTVESLYYKNLVICSDTGANTEIIQNGINGYIYKYGDYNQLADLILYISQNTDEALRIIENGEKAIYIYGKPVYMEYFSFYNEILT